MRYLLAIFIGTLLAGCATSPFAALRDTPTAPEKIASWTQEEFIQPRVVGSIDGSPIVANSIERRYSANSNETRPKRTLGQRIGGFFASLTIWGLLFVFICLVTVGGGPILWIYGKFLKAKSALKKTIIGIEELNEAEQKKVKEELLKSQDSGDKKYIAEIKAELKKDAVS